MFSTIYFNIIQSVHDQLMPDMFEDMRNDEAYDAFNSEVCHEYMSLGTALVIFIV